MNDAALKRAIRRWSNLLHIPVTRMMSRTLRELIHEEHMNTENFRDDWMTTFTGKQFYPFHPFRDMEAICLRDIAHALSLLCRYGGHCKRFYSVAEHSVHLANHIFFAAKLPASQRTRPRREILEMALQALFHDGSEAYITDIVRPLKRGMPEYKAIEAPIQHAIMTKFHLPAELPRYVDEIDRRILIDERKQNIRDQSTVWKATEGLEPLGINLKFWHPETAENKFLGCFYNITEELHR